MNTAALQMAGLHAGYPGHTVVHGIDLTLQAGQVTTIGGHNGAGKTTLLHTIAGLLPPLSGAISLHGDNITSWPTHRRARAHIGLVPQGKRLFASLTVDEHLRIGGADRHTREHVLDALPHLRTRLGHRPSQLSGGEQQMLAIARALTLRPQVLLLDEPYEGLAAQVIQQLDHIITERAATGTTVLMAEQRLTATTTVECTRWWIERGRLTHAQPPGPESALTSRAPQQDPRP